MKKLALWVLVLILSSSAFAQVDHVLGTDAVTVVPEQFLRGYDPITVFFPAPPLEPDRQGPEDDPDVLAEQGVFSLMPGHPGELIWIDDRTLQCIPTVPWPALARFTVATQGREHQLISFMREPTEILPYADSTDLDPLREMTLSFDTRLNPDTLAAMLSFEVTDLPGLGDPNPVWLTADDFTLKELERASLNDPIRYQLTFRQPITYGKHITLYVKLSLDDRLEGTVAHYNFETKPVFRMTAVGSAYGQYPVAMKGSVFSVEQAMNKGDNAEPLFVQFSDALGPVTLPQVKRFVSFEPAVEDFRYEVSGKRLYLYFNSDSEQLYKLTLRDVPFTDEAGRELAFGGETQCYVYYPHASPYLRWQHSQGIVERYGPQKFPMQGRGDEQADVRVYKLDPLDRNFWPFPDAPVEVDESQRPPGPGEEPDFAENMVAHIQLLGSPLVSRLMPLPMRDRPGDLQFGLDLKALFTQISGAGQPGTYLVGYRRLGSDTTRHYVRVQVTDLSLSTVEEESGVMFVVTSLKTGLPVAGAEVSVEADVYNRDRSWRTVVSGITDRNGQFHYQHEAELDAEVRRILVRHEQDTLVLNPDVAPPQFANNHWFNARSTWLGWLSEPPSSSKQRQYYRVHLLTERPVYRPEEPVHIKGYLRYWKEGRLYVPDLDWEPELVVQGPGNKQWSYAVELTDSGSFYHKFDEDDLPTGDYTVYLESPDYFEGRNSVSFKKEAYRIPRFEVNLAAPDRVPIDQPFTVTMTAEYYAGGNVTGQDVIWQVSRYNYTFAPPAYPGFLFSTMERFITDDGAIDDINATRSTAKTDTLGAAELDIDPSKAADAKPRVYVVEATVRGADEQTVTNTTNIIALPPFVLGLKTDRVLKDSTTIRPQILALDHASEPLEGQEIRLKVFQRQWHSYLVESDFTTGEAEYVSDVVDKLILERTVISAKKAVTQEIPVEEAGVYVVEISAQDRLGRVQKVSTDLFVAGDTPIAWEKPKAAVFETVPDKDEYEPGDTARILLKSPYQQARALVVVEEPERNTYHWIDIKKGQGLFSLAVTGDMTPAIPVHALLLRGRLNDAGGASLERIKEDRTRPQALGSTVWITVKPTSRQLQVELEHPDKALPGTTIPITITLTTPDGGAVDGEVTLWLVDRAVLALGEEASLDPVPSFLRRIESYIRIRDIRNTILGDLPIDDVPGGDGSERRKSLFDNVTVRKNFKTVPYFNPTIQVVNGKAEITVELPDNLTDFAIRAVATDHRERFGSAKSMISVRLPLIVQAALPRFVRPGDTFVAGGIGRVVEGDGGPGRVELQVEGLHIGTPVGAPALEMPQHHLSASDSNQSTSQAITWRKDEARQIYFPMQVTMPAAVHGDDNHVTVRLAVIREADNASDAFELRLPVKADRHQQKFDVFASLSADEPFTLLTPDEPARPGSISQHVLLTYEPALVKMLAGLNYLASYEHSCVEQRISRLLPELALKDLLDQLGLGDRSAAIEQPMEETFRYLERAFSPNGLYSYWPGSKPYVSLTAYVAEFLLLAQAQGYQFKEELLTGALQALEASLRSDYAYFIDGQSFTERVEALYALALAGRFQEDYAQDFLARATSMNLYSEAKILAAFLDQHPENQRAIGRLQDDLWSSLVFKLRDGEDVYAGLQYRADSWGGLINASEVKTMAGVARALHKAAPQHERMRVVIDELISRGNGDGWGSTNANAAALTALGDILGTPQPPEQGHTFTLAFGDAETSIDTSGQVVTRYEAFTADEGTITYAGGPTAGLPLLWNTLSYFPANPGDLVEQRNDGFVVDRELLIMQCDIGDDKCDTPPRKHPVRTGETEELSVGTIVEEHLRVVNPEERYFVAIRAPFAAGFEPLNPNLATAPKEAAPAGQMTRPPDYALYEDDQVTFYYDTLPKGTYDFYFRLKSTFEGSFAHPAANAELMYKQTVSGHSDGTRVVITAE